MELNGSTCNFEQKSMAYVAEYESCSANPLRQKRSKGRKCYFNFKEKRKNSLKVLSVLASWLCFCKGYKIRDILA